MIFLMLFILAKIIRYFVSFGFTVFRHLEQLNPSVFSKDVQYVHLGIAEKVKIDDVWSEHKKYLVDSL